MAIFDVFRFIDDPNVWLAKHIYSYVKYFIFFQLDKHSVRKSILRGFNENRLKIN